MKKIWDVGIKLKISIGFSLILLVLIGIQYGLNKSINNVIASQEELLISTKLSTQIESIRSSVIFFESRVKGYVLTGNDSVLKNTEKYLTDIVSKFGQLKTLSPSTKQITAIDNLVVLLNDEIKFTDEVMFQYQINPNRSIALIKTGKGSVLMTQILKEFDQIQLLEEKKFNEILTRNKQDSTFVRQMDASAYIFAFSLIAICVWVLFTDINKRQKLENELIITQKKAEKAAVVKEQFMANMSHEIRTPLNAILGFNNRLNNTQLSIEQKEYVEAVQISGQNLLAIVNDILDFSKIEAGMVKIECIDFSLSDLLQSVITMFQDLAKEKNIILELKISENLPALISGDPTRLTQILINLIGNALKFTEKGYINLTVDSTQAKDDNTTIKFSIKDTGIGISKEHISEIFERFTQAKSDTSRIFGGTGLGLSIAKKMVELQSGEIFAESTLGEGSEFTFQIPFKVSKVVADDNTNAPDTNESIKTNEAAKILVVEDNILNQKLAAFMLKDWGCHYHMCNNGKIAVEELKLNTYDIILMDIQMPEMNGYDATQYIRDLLKINTPIIAMTAHAMPGEREKCLSFGMTDYITKPIKESELKGLINTYLNVKFTITEA